MQVIVVDQKRNARDMALIDAMHRLRAKVFAERLHWRVDCQHGVEKDRFDDARPTYILLVEQDIEVVGCVRLLPPARASMLFDVFPQLLDEVPLDLNGQMIESSRFCIDRDPTQHVVMPGDALEARSLVDFRTRFLLAAILEWCLLNGYEELITVTDVRFERLLRIVGWPLRRLGRPLLIDKTESIAGVLAVTRQAFETLKPGRYRSLMESAAIAKVGSP
ncbi:MAG: GNAT family N-acetyltransferase [Rhizobiaceae bacterium]|nr:GNAT family N-acetyltransferase [Rhizobiaceae bacterium]